MTFLPHDPRERAERREAIRVLLATWGGVAAGLVAWWVLVVLGVW
jgi:hypothetical protein